MGGGEALRYEGGGMMWLKADCYFNRIGESYCRIIGRAA